MVFVKKKGLISNVVSTTWGGKVTDFRETISQHGILELCQCELRLNEALFCLSTAKVLKNSIQHDQQQTHV